MKQNSSARRYRLAKLCRKHSWSCSLLL